jgi:hypothetical protein
MLVNGMPRHWFVGSCYSAVAVFNLIRWGVLSLHWVPWALLGAGAYALVYTEVPEDAGAKSKFEFSNRNKASLATTAMGVVLLVFVMFRR